jgi:SAM-dependent methyltransferase
MIFDRVRNSAYAAAIRRVVTPDSVVLDVGAGLGVLGLIAAAAGAKKVYLVEPESVVQAAREVAVKNGFGDRVVALQGRIEDVDLPAKVDVITSVFTGNLLFSEDLLPSLFHARDRWLKPGGHLIPDIGQLMVAPISAPRMHEEEVGSWSMPHLGIDFGALRRYAANSLHQDRRAAFTPEFLAEPQVLVTSDLTLATTAQLDAAADFVVSSDAKCSGVVAWIRIRLGDAWLGTGPRDPSVHWTPQYLLVDPELPVAASEKVHFRLHRPYRGEWTWQVSARAGQRRQSTFLSQALSLTDLRKLSPDHKAKLNDRGMAAQFLLERMRGAHKNADLAIELCDAYPAHFTDNASALEFVRECSRRFCV